MGSRVGGGSSLPLLPCAITTSKNSAAGELQPADPSQSKPGARTVAKHWFAERLAIEVSAPGRDLSCAPVCRASGNTRTIHGFQIVLEPFLAFIGKMGEFDPIADRRMTTDNHAGGRDLRIPNPQGNF